MERAVKVDLGPRSYLVHIGADLVGQLGATVAAMAHVSGVVVICDETVGGLYGPRAIDSLATAAVPASCIQFPGGERHKTLATYAQIMDELLMLRPAIDRNTMIVALGGGVSGDVAGFVAATALRGLRLVQCPTTLLADVDSSVGGKTGVDHQAGKNLIGAFHQPCAVLIDVSTLKSLPQGELCNGLAECVKHAVIRDRELLDFIEAKAEQLLACNLKAMSELIARNVAIKAAVVAVDERESGVRAHLNFGHTIGHALETFFGYGRITHGQAVALGMAAACRMALRRGLLGGPEVARVENLLTRLRLAVRLPQAGADGEEIWRIMQHDKKAQAGKVRMVLPVALGRVEIFDDITPQEITQAILDISS